MRSSDELPNDYTVGPEKTQIYQFKIDTTELNKFKIDTEKLKGILASSLEEGSKLKLLPPVDVFQYTSTIDLQNLLPPKPSYVFESEMKALGLGKFFGDHGGYSRTDLKFKINVPAPIKLTRSMWAQITLLLYSANNNFILSQDFINTVKNQGNSNAALMPWVEIFKKTIFSMIPQRGLQLPASVFSEIQQLRTSNSMVVDMPHILRHYLVQLPFAELVQFTHAISEHYLNEDLAAVYQNIDFPALAKLHIHPMPMVFDGILNAAKREMKLDKGIDAGPTFLQLFASMPAEIITHIMLFVDVTSLANFATVLGIPGITSSEVEKQSVNSLLFKPLLTNKSAELEAENSVGPSKGMSE